MDALIFNPLQSNAAAIAGVATDATLAEGNVGGIDFSMLLALGMNASTQDAPAFATETKAKAEAATANDAPAPVAQLPIALPQPGTDIITSSAFAPDAPAAEAKANESASALPAAPAAADIIRNGSASIAERTSTAAVADQPANIAANPEKPAHPTSLATEIQNLEQRPHAAPDSQKAVEANRPIETATLSVAEAPTPAVHVHPLESRPPLSQPSALLEVQAPVSEPGFAQALSRQVVWMVDKDAQIAELRINPPELGPVEVRLTLTQDGAAAEFVSPHAEVRAALEGAIVRLREAFAEAGIQLGEASVSAESFSGRADEQAQNRNARDGYRDSHSSDAVSSSIVPASLKRGLVDVFA